MDERKWAGDALIGVWCGWKVVEARRQARELLDEQNVRTERRLAEQRRVENLLAAEELRHLETLARCKEDKVCCLHPKLAKPETLRNEDAVDDARLCGALTRR